MHPEFPNVPLSGVRGLIDGIDDALLALLAVRRQLVSSAAVIKESTGRAGRDGRRERDVYQRARRLGRRLGVPPATSDRLMSLLIDDACGQQGLHPDAATAVGESAAFDLDQRSGPIVGRMLPATMSTFDTTAPTFSWLRLLPPPTRLAPFLRRLPSALQARLLETAMQRVLAGPLADGALDALESRRLGIEVSDLGLRWVVVLRGGRMVVCAPDESAESTVRGTATDLLLLASRREDADTLFFQRRLLLTGDTELGLTARNLLDQMPWHEIPLGLRIALHRGAGLAQAARAAYHGEPVPD
ncbi:MAG: SCP2 sterol-binding domain-containing protein [Arenimonas sp.]